MGIRRFDFGYVLISIFIIFLVSSFLYTLKIDKDTQNNYQVIEKIETLKLLNKEFDIFLGKKLQYIKDETISNGLVNFINVLNLFANVVEKDIKDPEVKKCFQDLVERYEEKSLIMRSFTEQNGFLVTAVRLLFDLNAKIQKTYYFSPLVFKANKIIIYFMQSSYEEKGAYGISKDIQEMSGLIEQNRLVDKTLDIFVTQSFASMSYIDNLNKLDQRKEKVGLEESLNNFRQSIVNHFEKNAKVQKILLYIMFGLDVFLFLFLVMYYVSDKKNRAELIKFAKAVENSDNTIVITDTNRNITYVNDAFERSTGYAKKEALGQNPRILKSGFMAKEHYKQMNEKLNRGERWEGEFINRRKDGSIYYESASIVPIMNAGEVESFLAIKLDVTDYVKQKEELEKKTQRLNEAQSVAHIGSWEFDLDAKHIECSDEIYNIFGQKDKKKFLHPNEFFSYVHSDDKSMVSNIYLKMLKYKDDFDFEFRIISAQKLLKHVQLKGFQKLDLKGRVVKIFGTLQDITNLVRTREKINYMAYHDHLTDLSNRLDFENKLEHAVRLARRNNSIIAVLFIDLDRFKIINDTLGHHVGDEILKTVAFRISSVLRESDTVARLGGDEFAVLLENLSDNIYVASVCEKILSVVSEPIRFESYNLDISASIGIAIFPQDGVDYQEIIKNADSAMYLAKDKGKNNFQFYTKKLSKEVERRLGIEQSLKNAIRNNEFYLEYQPKYDIQTKKVIGAEALIRWQNSDFGFVSPLEFIPIAEECGFIVDIGEWVFSQACKAFLKWQDEKLKIETIAINVSSVQFRQKDIVARFNDIASQFGISPSCIDIEITEHYIMDNTEKNFEILRRFREVGFKISVDDFGTGYSSMSYLKILPLDTIKIDKSFIDDIPHDKNDVEITKAILALSLSLGYNVVAEGIETKEQEEFLLNNGCRYGQGFLFGKPMKSDDFIGFVKNTIKP
ncbi:MAG: EAL domain-containing protein [Sulfurospirillaceae bacterium]|nr:EAL domain-containing protein [Sulfurospirillaceae bacterium]